MSIRESFRMFMRFQLGLAIENGQVIMKESDIDKFIEGVEDDPTFYDELSEFLDWYIEIFGENYGIH